MQSTVICVIWGELRRENLRSRDKSIALEEQGHYHYCCQRDDSEESHECQKRISNGTSLELSDPRQRVPTPKMLRSYLLFSMRQYSTPRNRLAQYARAFIPRRADKSIHWSDFSKAVGINLITLYLCLYTHSPHATLVPRILQAQDYVSSSRVCPVQCTWTHVCCILGHTLN